MRKMFLAALALAGATFVPVANAAPMPQSGSGMERMHEDGMIQQARHWRGHGMRHHGWRRGHHYGWRHRHHRHMM